MILTELWRESWGILKESAAYILVGFLIAAVLHVLMARGRWVDWLKGLGSKSVLLASTVGLPLPLCSCSVLPAAISLRKRGASKGAILSFLISTPETSVQSVLLTYSLLGPVMAIYRPVAGWVTAMVAGLAQNFAERHFPDTTGDAAIEHADAGGDETCAACCDVDHAGPGDHLSLESTSTPLRPGWLDGLRHAFVDVFDDVFGWMLIGIVVAAGIQVFVPDFLIDAVFGGTLQAMLVMLLIGIPLYVCAEASTPIAAVLITQGVSPGAALVFLLAGPATNLGSIGVLTRQLGRRTVVIYLASIAVVSVAMGLSLDWLFGLKGVTLSARALDEPLLPLWVKQAGAVVFLAMCVMSMHRRAYADRLVNLLDRWLPVRVTQTRLGMAVVIGLVIGYVGSGFFIIEPGQVGMVKRFGRVVRADLPPGLHYTWPSPVGAVDKIDTRRVYRLAIGEVAANANEEEATRPWVLLGDENIANIKCAAHWHMKPGQSRQFAYGVVDREQLVGDAVRAALRFILASSNIDTVFTTDQAALGERIREQAQEILDRRHCGIEIMTFAFLDLHAPAEVHDAFRDIASALEDRATRQNRALTLKARIVPLAEGSRDQLLHEARAYGAQVEAEAAGEAHAFLQTYEAYREFPNLTRTRLIFEMYDRVLPGLRKCVKPSTEDLYLDLRYGPAEKTVEEAL